MIMIEYIMIAGINDAIEHAVRARPLARGGRQELRS
jgi:hypothetical protein